MRSFLKSKYETPGDKYDADAVLQISASINKELYVRLKGDDDMCQALREIMSEEINQSVKMGEQNAKVLDIRNVMESLNVTSDKAMDILRVDVADRATYEHLVNQM